MERNIGLFVGIIGCIIGFSGLGLGAYNMINFQVVDGIQGPEGPEGPPGSENMIELLSGIYTGLQLYGKNVLIPEGNNVTFQNAQILGGELYVYGNLTILDSEIDHSINGFGNGKIDIINLEILNHYSTIHLYENCSTVADNIISKTRYAIVCYVFDNSILNTTNLLPHMSIAFYSNSQGTIRYCNITHLDCFEQSQVYLLQNTTVYELRCFGTPGNPYNSAIIYKDSTSTITLPPTLYDDAQIIDI